MHSIDNTGWYYEVLRNLNELLVVLKENNIMLKELVSIIHEDHKTNLDISDNVKKIKFNTQ